MLTSGIACLINIFSTPVIAELAASAASLPGIGPLSGTAGGFSDSVKIRKYTTAYVIAKFAVSFGYTYRGLASTPPIAAPPIDADCQLITINPLQKNGNDLLSYFETLLNGSFSQADSIAIASNLSKLISMELGQARPHWTGFSKRFNMTGGLIFDIYAATACNRTKAGKSAGLCAFCFVAYTPTSH